MLPFLEKSIFPVLIFDADIQSYLQTLERLQIMQCEAFMGIEGVMNTSMALDYCYYHDMESALQIIDLYRAYCDARIELIEETAKHLSPEDRKEITDIMEQKKAEAISFAKTIQSEPETIRRMIEENTAISEKNCGSFFTSRFFSR